MQGQQEYQAKLFSTVNLEALIPAQHLLRRIDKALDLKFVREMTASLYCEDNGRPSIDPEVFFRITLLTYLYDIPSDRQVCEEIRYNMLYRWFCRLSLEDTVPDHSSLTRIRDRMGVETFRKIFEKMIRHCIDKKLIKATKVMMDGSLIKADAALNSMVEKNEEGNPSDKEPPKYIKGNKYSNDTHVSYSDPDSTLAGKAGEPKHLRYKVHTTIDRESRIIIDPHVTTGAEVEGKVCLERVDHIEKTFDLKIEELTADRGYGYGENLQAFEDRKINSFVPRFHSDAGDRVERDSKGFTFDKERDCYICPKGHLMFHIQGSTPEYKRYRMVGGHCSKCPLRGTCLNLPTMKTRGAKHIEVNIYQEQLEKTALKEKAEEFKNIRGERQWKAEGIFAEGKVHHGLGRARYRGLGKMQIQAYMISFVQNVKRLLELRPEAPVLVFIRLKKIWESFFRNIFSSRNSVNFSPTGPAEI